MALLSAIGLNPLYTLNPKMGTLTNIEDPDEMPHYASISICAISTLQCLC